MKLPIGLAVAFVMVAHGALAQNDTKAALGAREVKELIHISLGQDGKKALVRTAIDDDLTPEPVTADRVFVARKAVSVVYRDPNPLSLALAAGIEEADDPANTALVKIIEALTGIPPIIAGGVGADSRGRSVERTEMFRSFAVPEDGTTCQAAIDAYGLLDALRANLFPAGATPRGLARNLDEWVKALDAAAASTGGGVRARLLEEKNGIIRLVKDEAEALKAHIDAATKQADTIDAEVAKAPGATVCEQLTRAVYSLAVMTQPRRRIGELQRIKKSLDDLATSLTEFAASGRWIPSNQRLYLVTTVAPSSAKLQRVTVKATELKYTVPDDSSGITAVRSEPTSGTFTVRKFDKWVTELGAGLISAEIATPKYGTVERDGKTFAERVSEDEWSWAPAVIGNFVCRCWDGDKLNFMVQLGAVPSKDTPAVLGGIGARLFGGAKGGVGVSVGFVHAWVKEIPDDVLAKPITGTKDIEANKRFVERWKPYFMLQYQF